MFNQIYVRIMKKLLLITMLILPLSVFAQSEAEVKSQTTFEKFTSTIGHIVKFKDYSLPDITGKDGSGLLAVYYIVHAQVRQVIVGDDTSLFLRLSYKPDQNTPTRYAFIKCFHLAKLVPSKCGNFPTGTWNNGLCSCFEMDE